MKSMKGLVSPKKIESPQDLGIIYKQSDNGPSMPDFGADSFRPIKINLESQSPEVNFQKPKYETPRMGSGDSPPDRTVGDKQQERIQKITESPFSHNKSPTKIRLKSQDNGPSSNSMNIDPKTLSSTALNNVIPLCLKLFYTRSPGKHTVTQSGNYDHLDFAINPPRLPDMTNNHSMSKIRYYF
jgi:hypothetical protein